MANLTKTYFNPLYTKALPVWEKMRDTVQSEEWMKQRAWADTNGWIKQCSLDSVSVCTSSFSQYLFPTEGMMTSSVGKVRYSNYIRRAKWYPFPLDTHDQALGMINNQLADIELSNNLEYLRVDATSSQESLDTVLGVVNSQQIITSRLGIVGEATNDRSRPFNLEFYYAESACDWRVDIAENGEEIVTWVKLKTDECLDNKPIYLILRFDDEGNYVQYMTTSEDAEPNIWGVADDGFIAESYAMPIARGNASKVIPFVCVNLSRLGLNNIQKPWLESISDAAIKLFQASAEYEDGLHWGGQSTFTGTGVESKEMSNVRLGNGGKASSTSKDAKFAYVTAGTDGITPSKDNVTDLKNDCMALGVDLINQGVESGVALDTRMSVKTASLKTLAKTGAEGLQRILRILAVWIGDNPADVKVVANTEFADVKYTAEELQKLGALVKMGEMRQEDLFNIQKKQGITMSEDYDAWLVGLETEDQTGSL